MLTGYDNDGNDGNDNNGMNDDGKMMARKQRRQDSSDRITTG